MSSIPPLTDPQIVHQFHLTPARLAQWLALCEWLEGQPSHAAYFKQVPATVERDLLSPAVKCERDAVRVVFYGTGWGWRLRKEWRGRHLWRIAEAAP